MKTQPAIWCLLLLRNTAYSRCATQRRWSRSRPDTSVRFSTPVKYPGVPSFDVTGASTRDSLEVGIGSHKRRGSCFFKAFNYARGRKVAFMEFVPAVE